MRSNVVLCMGLAGVLIASGCGGGGGDKNAAPTAAFTVSCDELRCTFVNGSADTDGSIVSNSWSFGDDLTSADTSPVHTYGAPGTYTVTLKVTDDGNATGTTSRQITMRLPPIAKFDLACSGLACTMTDTSTDARGSSAGIASRSWSFGDGATSTEQNPSHAYASAGTYSIALTVVDLDGESTTAAQEVTVVAPPPPPAGSPPTARFAVACNSNTCAFTDQSTDSGGTVTAWSWSFGDGTGSTTRNPSHTYGVSSLTTVTVVLTVTDNDGAKAIASRTFTVSPPAGLQCRDAANTGELTSCDIVLAQAARIEVELTDRECGALGNTFIVKSPVERTLFTNGCFEPAVLPATYTLSDTNGGPFPAGTVFSAQMISGSATQVIPPSLIIAGSASPWTIQFDDGAVAPRDLDLVITIRAVP